MAKARIIIFSVFIFVFTKSSFGSTTETPPSEKGGLTAAAANSAPFVVSLQSEGKHYCTGNILSANWVLTAAHCLLNTTKVLDTTLVAGSISLTDNESTTQKRPINYYVINDLYTNVPSFHDIGLIYTAEPFTWSNAVAAVTLPESGTTPSGNAIFYGWDLRASKNSAEHPSTLQVATVPILPKRECISAVPPIVADYKMYLCTAGDACTLNSGSPLIQQTNNKNVLIGMALFGLKDACPTVSLLISSQIPWINANQVVPSKLK